MDYINDALNTLSIGLKKAENSMDLSIESINKIMGELIYKADPNQQKMIISQKKQINSFIKQAKQGKDINKVISNIEKQIKDLENAGQYNK